MAEGARGRAHVLAVRRLASDWRWRRRRAAAGGGGGAGGASPRDHSCSCPALCNSIVTESRVKACQRFQTNAKPHCHFMSLLIRAISECFQTVSNS
ncbi:hypothetical protein JYU34_006963 [Plutella xylostella]|uniref:Uncharacterized protein n=1 Tax=Plutella xylostella TaxID=51655 RepID=A0ABQ7QT90_PLUXY|nr:hypothetical protein JYU34_006963 [Plutella xylostella]